MKIINNQCDFCDKYIDPKDFGKTENEELDRYFMDGKWLLVCDDCWYGCS